MTPIHSWSPSLGQTLRCVIRSKYPTSIAEMLSVSQMTKLSYSGRSGPLVDGRLSPFGKPNFVHSTNRTGPSSASIQQLKGPENSQFRACGSMAQQMPRSDVDGRSVMRHREDTENQFGYRSSDRRCVPEHY